MSARSRIRRTVKVSAATLGVVVGLLVLGVCLVLFLRPARERLLSRGIEEANKALPGQLVVRDANWPSLASLELDGLTWTDGADTLAALDHLAVEIDLVALVRKDVHVHSLIAEHVRVDLPAIETRFPPQPPATDESHETAAFPRQGSVPALPSIGVDDASVQVDRFVLAAGDTVSLRTEFGADIRHQSLPSLHLKRLEARWSQRDWSIERGDLTVDLNAGALSGDVEGHLGPDAPLTLHAATNPDGSYRVELLQTGHQQPPDGPGVVVTGKLEREGTTKLKSFHAQFSAQLPSTSMLSSLSGQDLKILGHAGTVDLMGDARVTLEPLTASGSIEIATQHWPVQTQLQASYESNRLTVPRLQLRGDGLEVDASGSYEDPAWLLNVRVDLRDVTSLEPWVDIAKLPRDARLTASGNGTGQGESLEASFHLEASALSAGLDSLRAQIDGRLDGENSRIDFDVEGAGQQLAVDILGRIQGWRAPQLQLAPIVVSTVNARYPRPGAVPTLPNVLANLDARSIELRGLQIMGAAGDVTLTGNVSEDTGGALDLELRWPRPPEALARVGFDAAARDTMLGPGWTIDGEPQATLHADLSRGLASWELDGGFRLPPPWLFLGLADSTAGLAAWGPPPEGALLGEIQSSGERRGELWHGTANVNLASTAWLDTAQVQVEYTPQAITVQSMRLDTKALHVSASGQWTHAAVAGSLRVQLQRDPILRRFLPELPPDLEFAGILEASASGPVDSLNGDTRLQVSARTKDIRIPYLEANLQLQDGILQGAKAHLPEGFVASALRMDSIALEARPERPAEAWFPMWASVEARGPRFSWVQVARIDSTQAADSTNVTWSVRTDTLSIGAGTRSMDSHQPFELLYHSATKGFAVDGLDLFGELGSLRAQGHLTDDPNLHASLDLREFPLILERLGASPEMMPDELRVRFDAVADSAQLSVTAEGMNLGPHQDVRAALDAERNGRRAAVKLEAHAGDTQVAEGDFSLPLEFDLRTRNVRWYDGELSGGVRLIAFPLPARPWSVEGISDYLAGVSSPVAPIIDAELELSGTGAQPRAGLATLVTFPGMVLLEKHRVELLAVLSPDDGYTLNLGSINTDHADLHGLLADGGFAGSFRWSRESVMLGAAEFHVPLRFSTTEGPQLDRTKDVLFDLSRFELDLSEWNALTPQDFRGNGHLSARAKATGPIANPSIEGSITAQNLRVEERNNHVTASGQMEVHGTVKSPVVRGNLTVENGLIRISSHRRTMHPTRGQSLLWELEGVSAFDSMAVAPTDTATNAAPEAQGDVDVTVTIPNSFWIRGSGMEVQLAGDLKMIITGDGPKVIGELRAVGGSLTLMGVDLRMQRGSVYFVGGAELNPGLDLELQSIRGNVRITVRVTGTANRPRLTFSSDPPMDESDILAYLMFGQSSTNLDTAQNQLVADQASLALQAFAAPMLEESLSNSLGVTVTLKQGREAEAGMSLVLGHYITPQLLVRYEQSLRDSRYNTINLEYWLNQHLRVETRVSQENKTGASLNWSSEY